MEREARLWQTADNEKPGTRKIMNAGFIKATTDFVQYLEY